MRAYCPFDAGHDKGVLDPVEAPHPRMIPKGGNRFSDKIIRK
jgi:hypothetical protein